MNFLKRLFTSDEDQWIEDLTKEQAEKEITRMCKLKRPGQAFLVGNGESQLYWKLREKSGR